MIQGRLYGRTKARAQARAQELIASLELEDCADRQTKTYSGGQKRRLDIGVGLMHLPQLLFLDEPTTGLDPPTRARMWYAVRRLRATGQPVFLHTHSIRQEAASSARHRSTRPGPLLATWTPHPQRPHVAR